MKIVVLNGTVLAEKLDYRWTPTSRKPVFLNEKASDGLLILKRDDIAQVIDLVAMKATVYVVAEPSIGGGDDLIERLE